ncbi:MAG: hypothetical protein ACRDA5_04330 [Clostridium sp.]
MLENEVLVENEEVISLDKILAEDEVQEIEEESELIAKEDVKNNEFSKNISAKAIEQIIIFAGSLAIQLVFGLLLKLFGYHIVEQDKIFILIYLIINIVYEPVCKMIKLKKSVVLDK